MKSLLIALAATLLLTSGAMASNLRHKHHSYANAMGAPMPVAKPAVTMNCGWPNPDPACFGSNAGTLPPVALGSDILTAIAADFRAAKRIAGVPCPSTVATCPEPDDKATPPLVARDPVGYACYGLVLNTLGDLPANQQGGGLVTINEILYLIGGAADLFSTNVSCQAVCGRGNFITKKIPMKVNLCDAFNFIK